MLILRPKRIKQWLGVIADGFSILKSWVKHYHLVLAGITPKVTVIALAQQQIQAMEVEIRNLRCDSDLLNTKWFSLRQRYKLAIALKHCNEAISSRHSNY